MMKQTKRASSNNPPGREQPAIAWIGRGRAGAESGEAGYVLVGVIFMVALVLLSLAIAAPKIASAIQRDRELELVHRGEQYKRAVRLYYKKFGRYPTSIDQLEKTNEIRFLRKRYLDPLTGKDDWKLIHMGEAHVRPLGFFGQPLGAAAALSGASTVSNGGFVSNDSGSATTQVSNGSFGSSTLGGAGAASGLPGGAVAGGVQPGSTLGGCYALVNTSGTSGSGSGSGTAAGSTGGSSGSGSTSFGSSTGSSFGSSNGSSFGTVAGSSSGSGAGSGFGSGTGSGAGTASGLSASTTLGGAPVCGVEPPQNKLAILQYRLKTHYNEWEFTYDPVEEQTAGTGSVLGGTGNLNGTGSSQSVSGSASSGIGGLGSNGSNSNSSGGGNSFGGGSTGYSGAQQTPPQ